jgi:hypothetical protein
MKKKSLLGIAAIAFAITTGILFIACDQPPASSNGTPVTKAQLDAPTEVSSPLWTDASLPDPTDGGYGTRYADAIGSYLEDIAYGGAVGREKYVVVGQFAHIAYSDNGKDWTLVPRALNDIDGVTTQFSTEGRPMGIAYGNGKFVVVGNGHEITYSSDGIAWHKVPSEELQGMSGGSQYSLRAVAYGGPAGSEKFVAVGYQGGIIYSADGVHWTKVTSSPIINKNTYGVKYIGGKFIAECSASIAYSDNGVDWTLVTGPGSSENFGDVAFINGKFAVSVNDLTDGRNIKYSVFLMDDIASWSSESQIGLYDIFGEFDSGNQGIRVLASGGPAGKEKLVAVTVDRRYAYSADGVTWTPFTTNYYSIYLKYAGGKYFVMPTLTEASTPSLIYTTPEELD